MNHAFKMRRLGIERGNQPYGAVIVKDNRIVGERVRNVVTVGDRPRKTQ
jgi:tRNA(Arg) A34 adenosine deaminase TadA